MKNIKRLFDTHAHYNDSRFKKEFGGDTFEHGAEIAMREVFNSYPVGWILNAGTSPETSIECMNLSERFDTVYASSGIHPSDTRFYTINQTYEMVEKIEKLLSHPKCVAVGEIGFDYHYPNTDKKKQYEFFEAQMCLAEKYKLPVIIHDREAHGDCFEMIKRHPDVTGVFHSCSESSETVKELAKRGWYLSFSGVVTYQNAENVRKAALAVPHDRILTETDCPYLTPHPFRGKTNHSGYMVKTAEKLAELMNVSFDEFCEISTANAMRLFRIDN